MSSGRLGPPSRAPSCRRRRNAGQAARAGQQVDGLADHRLFQGGPGRGGAGPGLTALAELVELDAEPDQILQRVHVDVAGDDRGHRRVAGDRRGGVPVQPRAVGRAGLGGVRAARGPPRPDLPGPLVLQGGVAVEQHQVGQGDVRPGLDRLPGPLRQQVRRGQPAHRLGQRVVVPLPLGPVVFFPGRGGQRVQHRGHRRGAPGGQVAVQDPGAADGGGQLHLAVGELPARVLIRQVPAGPHVHLGEQRRQVRQPQARRPRPPATARRPGPGTPGGACRSTGRSPDPPIRRPARPPAPPVPADAWPPAWPRRECPTAAPRVMPVRWISQETAL